MIIEDPDGKLLFVESVRTADENGDGFIDYMWQWKDDSTRIVPKLSYVMEFKPWNWIVGTGIYLEDVRMEIVIIKKTASETGPVDFHDYQRHPHFHHQAEP